MFLISILLLATLALLQASCSGNDPQNTLAAKGIVAQKQQDLFWLFFWLAVVVFFLVEGLLLFTVIRYRRKAGHGIPAQVHGNTRLEIAWTIAPTVALIAVAIPTVTTIFELADTPDVALNVTVIGHQWWWEFQYPGLGVVTASEMHIPVGEAVSMRIESADVQHSFWVPKLGGKQDALPSRINTLWFKADSPGTYIGECAELCGVEHAKMRIRVVAQSPADFEAWAKAQKTAPATPSGDAARGLQVFQSNACIGCHTIQGTAGAGTIGPNLSHIGSRTTLAGASMDNTAENMAKWLRDPQAVKSGTIMPNLHLPEDQISALVAYLATLK